MNLLEEIKNIDSVWISKKVVLSMVEDHMLTMSEKELLNQCIDARSAKISSFLTQDKEDREIMKDLENVSKKIKPLTLYVVRSKE